MQASVAVWDEATCQTERGKKWSACRGNICLLPVTKDIELLRGFITGPVPALSDTCQFSVAGVGPHWPLALVAVLTHRLLCPLRVTCTPGSKRAEQS